MGDLKKKNDSIDYVVDYGGEKIIVEEIKQKPKEEKDVMDIMDRLQKYIELFYDAQFDKNKIIKDEEKNGKISDL